MKHTVIFILFIGLLFSCSGNNPEPEPEPERPIEVIGERCNVDTTITACGIYHPQKNLPWLAEFIEKAEIDTTLNYSGWIWLEQFKGKDLFVVRMMLQSGVFNHFFDCEGNNAVPDQSDPIYPEFESFSVKMKLETLVYTNVPFGCP